MKLILTFLIIFNYSFIYSQQSDTIVLLTEKVKGQRIIPCRFSNTFYKDNEGLIKFKFDNSLQGEINLFKLDLNSENLEFYCLTIRKDTSINLIFDTDHDMDFRNNKIYLSGFNSSELINIPIEIDSNNDKLWVKIKSAEFDNKGSLIDISCEIFEYRIAKFKSQDSIFNIRIESMKDVDYSYPYISTKIDNFIDKVDRKVRIDEYIKLGNNIYKFIYSSLQGDTIKLLIPKNKTDLSSTQIGYKAKELKGISIVGDSVSLNSYKGKYLLLDFWHTRCPACIMEMNEYLKEYYETYGGDYFEVLGVDGYDNKEELSKFMQNHNYNWPQLLTSLNSKYINDYHIFYFPTYYLIDTSGMIIENDLWGLATLPYILNKVLPKDYLVKKLLKKKNLFSYKGYSNAKYPLLRIKKSDGKQNSYILYMHDGKWQFSLDLPDGDYYYCFYFDGKEFTDPTNSVINDLNNKKYSFIHIKN